MTDTDRFTVEELSQITAAIEQVAKAFQSNYEPDDYITVDAVTSILLNVAYRYAKRAQDQEAQDNE